MTDDRFSQIPNDTFGIDHPLVTVRDHEAVLEAYRKMGFRHSPVSLHPWGTATSLVMFPGNFIELISVVDPSKYGTNATGDFCFGRFLGGFLDKTEGVSLIGLHSRECDGDHDGLVRKGIPSEGRVDFRRAMTLPDGTPDVAVVSLGLIVDPDLPEASSFLCQQHKPELIWVPDWCLHPNGALGIAAVTYRSDDARLPARLSVMYGDGAGQSDGARIYQTAGGEFRLLSGAQVEARYAELDPAKPIEGRPRAVAIEIMVRSLRTVGDILRNTRVPFEARPDRLLVGSGHGGGTIIEFVEKVD